MTSPEPTSAPAIRPATPADYELFARLFLELKVDDPVLDRERWQKELAPETLVIEDEAGRGAGYAFVNVLAGVGYVRHLAVDPSFRRRGFGRALLLEVAKRLRGAGCEQWCLNVKPDNEGAIALYQGLGMAPEHLATALRFDWSLAAALPRSPDVIVSPLLPGDDAAVECTFGLSPGQLAHARTLGGRVILAVTDRARGELFAGVAVFDPAFPGAFPFRVSRPELAADLLAALQPHALPSLPYMHVVARDAALTRLLLDRGARVRFEMVHLRGLIPSV